MIMLGDEVQDSISGFKGIATARHFYLQGCDRITITPQVDDDGKMKDEASFDEPQLKVITPEKIRRQAIRNDPGGPDKHVDSKKSLGH